MMPYNKSINVRMYIFQCRDIPAADDDGLTDCYIKIWNQYGKDKRTKTIDNSVNPTFYQTIDVGFDFEDRFSNAAPLILNLWDANQRIAGVGSKDVYLGSAIIPFADASTNLKPEDFIGEVSQIRNLKATEIPAVPVPKWHNIVYGNNNSTNKTGEILCSFCVMKSDQNLLDWPAENL